MAFEIGWTPIGQTRGTPVHIDITADTDVGHVRFSNGISYYFHPSQHAQVIRWFKWWFDDMVEH